LGIVFLAVLFGLVGGDDPLGVRNQRHVHTLT
jgi:hypothetical protein